MSTTKKQLLRPKAFNCELCLKQFSFMVKQHQCKRCERAVCAECGKNKSIIPQYDLKTPHRVCQICKDEQSFISEFISKETLIFNQDSLTTKRWLSYISSSLEEKELKQDYFDTLKQSKGNLNKELQTQIEQVPQLVLDFKNHMNYSYTEFNFYSIKDLPDNVPTIYVQSVVQCLLYKNPKIKLTQNMVKLIYFLLFFNSQPIVYFLINYLREELVLSKYLDSQQQATQTEIDFLMEIGKKNLLINQCDLIYLRKFLEKYAFQFLSQLFINLLNFPSTYFLFDHLLKQKDIYELEKTVAIIGKLQLQEIKSKGLEYEVLTQSIVKNVKASHIKEYLIKEDRIRLNSKRDVHSKSDDLFQQFQTRVDSQQDLKNILQVLDECINKLLPLNNYHKQIISRLSHKQQNIIYELIGQRKLSCVQEEKSICRQDEINEEDTKGETCSEASLMILKYDKTDLLEQNRKLQDENQKLKEQLEKQQQQRKQDHSELEQVLQVQEEIKKNLETQLQQQEQLILSDHIFQSDLDKKECLSPIATKREISSYGQEVHEVSCQCIQIENEEKYIQTTFDIQAEIENLQQQLIEEQSRTDEKQYKINEQQQIIDEQLKKMDEQQQKIDEELQKQKQYYELKLQAIAIKQQKLIQKLTEDFSQTQQQTIKQASNHPRSNTVYTKPVQIINQNQQQQDIINNQELQVINEQQEQQAKKGQAENKDCIIF